MKNKKAIYSLYIIITVMLYSLGTMAYLHAGEAWYDATYYTLQMFFMNYSEPDKAGPLLYFIRFACPIMTFTGLFSVMWGLVKKFSDRITLLFPDATAIYYDVEPEESVVKSFRHAILCGTRIRKARSQVLMFSNDRDDLSFYANNRHKFRKNSKTYIMLDQTNSNLLAESNVHYFNAYEIIARLYWKERNLLPYLKNNSCNVKIALIGFGTLGQKLLEYGLINNLYCLNQTIEYHIWGDSKVYREVLGTFDMMNNDRVVFHDESWKDSFSNLQTFDRIILSGKPNLEMIQSFLSLDNHTEIDCYNPQGILLSNMFANEHLNTFGETEKILTEENIKTDKLYLDAKKLNFNFAILYDNKKGYSWQSPNRNKIMEQLWQNLNGFTKGSNIACTDYHEIRKLIMQSDHLTADTLSEAQMETLAELEHIRWTRYHFVNHWTYAKLRDNQNKHHPSLIAFHKLSAKEQSKDKEMIQMLFELEKTQ